MTYPANQLPPKVKRAETVILKNIEGVPHFIIATDEEDYYIEGVALVLLDEDVGNSGWEKKIPGDTISLDRIILIDPISADETTVYQYPQELIDTEKSAALVLLFLNNDAAIGIVQGWGPRNKNKRQASDLSKKTNVSAFNPTRDKQLVIEWLQRAEAIGEYLSAVIK